MKDRPKRADKQKMVLQLQDQGATHPLKGRPPNAYAFFQTKYRVEHASQLRGLTTHQVSQTIAKIWKTMTSEDKLPFENAFQEALGAWKASKEARPAGDADAGKGNLLAISTE